MWAVSNQHPGSNFGPIKCKKIFLIKMISFLIRINMYVRDFGSKKQNIIDHDLKEKLVLIIL